LSGENEIENLRLTDIHTSLDTDKIGGLQPATVSHNVSKASALTSELESLLPDSNANSTTTTGPWLFGLEHPTALDAHLIVFINRMRDVGRDALIPERLGAYADVAMGKKEWVDLMQGRKTMIGK
jgi:hypothetical protein